MAISERPDLIHEGDDRFRSKWDGQRMSLDKFMALPEEKPALEYDEGSFGRRWLQHQIILSYRWS